MNKFRVLAVEALVAPEADSDKMAKMLKKLKPGEIYQFFYDYEFKKEGNAYKVTRKKTEYNDGIYNHDFRIYKGHKLEVDICAVVGQNGSGKSSVVDLMMRIINNYAASILGEFFTSRESEHLHYIHGLYARLYYLKRDFLYWIKICGDEVSVFKVKARESDGQIEWITEEGCCERNYPYTYPENFKGKAINRKDLCLLFYTFICNYGIHSYIPDNFSAEFTDTDLLELIYKESGQNKTEFTDEERCWLKGLFHKNDGYQTPLVINPMRNNGNIDIKNDFKLSKERLIALLHHKDRNGGQLYRTLNKGLIADSVTYTLKNEQIEVKLGRKSAKKCNRYSVRDIYVSLGFWRQGKTNIKTFQKIHNDFKCEIQKRMELKVEPGGWQERVMDYAIYKLLKITRTYDDYLAWGDDILNAISTPKGIARSRLVGLLNKILADHTHVTTKFWQALFFLKYYEKYDSIKWKNQNEQTGFQVKIEDYASVAYILLQEGEQTALADKETTVPKRLEELLVPSAFYAELNLISEEREIPFYTLSSGEKQLIFTISSLLYHILNIDSVANIKSDLGGSRRTVDKRISYDSVFAVFDEVELYFHPEMQRQFISYLLTGLKQMDFVGVKSVHILLVTHSPFILSDIPSGNILFLNNEGLPDRERGVETFGANIHHLLRTGFFLNSAKGNFVINYIGHIAALFELIQQYTTANTKSLFFLKEHYSDVYQRITENDKLKSPEDIKKVFPYRLMNDMISLIDEPLVKRAFLEKLKEIYKKDFEQNENWIEEQIRYYQELKEKQKK